MRKTSLPPPSVRRISPHDKKKTNTTSIAEPKTDVLYLGMIYTELEKKMLIVLAECQPSTPSSWQTLNPETRETARLPWSHSGDSSDGRLWQFQLRHTIRPEIQKPLGNSSTVLLSGLSTLSLSNAGNSEINQNDQSDLPAVSWSDFSVDPATRQPVIEFLKVPEKAVEGSQRVMRSLGKDFTPLEELREHFFERGIPSPPVSPTMLISSDDKFCIGSVTWRQLSDEEDARFIPHMSDVTKVPVISPAPALSTNLRDANGKILRIVCSELKQPSEYHDFRPDSQILAEQSRRMTVSQTPADQELDRLLETVLKDSPTPPRGSFTEFRVRSIFNRWKGSSGNNAELENFVLKLPEAIRVLKEAEKLVIAQEVEKNKIAIEAELENLRIEESSIRQKIAESNKFLIKSQNKEQKGQEVLDEINIKCDQIRADIKVLEGRKISLNEEIGGLEATITRQSAEVEERLISEIARFKNKSAAELASLLPLRHALGLDNITVQMDREPIVPVPLPIIEKTESSVGTKGESRLFSPFTKESNKRTNPCEDMADAVGTLKRALKSQGGRGWESLAFPSIAAMMAGLVPVVAGEDSGKFWQTVANALCGGRRLSVTIPPYATRPSDLIGETHDKIFIPHASRLADLLLDQAEELSLVVIEEVDGVDWSAVLKPLLSARNEDRFLPLLHPMIAERSGIYAKLQASIWPKSILLSGTWRGWGVPPSPAFWQQSILLLPESEEYVPIGQKPPTSHLPLSDWKDELAKGSTGENNLASDEVRQMQETTRKSGGPVASSSAFLLALTSLGKPPDEAMKMTNTHILLPWQVAHDKVAENADTGQITRLRSILFGSE